MCTLYRVIVSIYMCTLLNTSIKVKSKWMNTKIMIDLCAFGDDPRVIICWSMRTMSHDDNRLANKANLFINLNLKGNFKSFDNDQL